MTKLHMPIIKVAESRYDVIYNYDAMPIHEQGSGFKTIEDAKASVPYDVEWSMPDDEASFRDVAATAWVVSK